MALLCPEWQERVGDGEQNVPTLRAPDDTLIYLVQPEPDGRFAWEDDFHMLPGSSEPPVLTRFDHFAQALPAGAMDTHVLFWRAVFGLTPEPM